jgi:hypothetical protein
MMGADEPETWLTVREAAARLKVTEPRLRRAIERTGTGTVRETQTKTGTRPGVCVRVSDLPALLAAMETGTGTAARHEPEQEQTPRVITFSARAEPAVSAEGASRPSGPSPEVLAAQLAAEQEKSRLLIAQNMELQRLVAVAEERERRQAEQLSAALQAVANQQQLTALPAIREALGLPAPEREQEEAGVLDGKKNGRAGASLDGSARPVVGRMRVKVTQQWRPETAT